MTFLEALRDAVELLELLSARGTLRKWGSFVGDLWGCPSCCVDYQHGGLCDNKECIAVRARNILANLRASKPLAESEDAVSVVSEWLFRALGLSVQDIAQATFTVLRELDARISKAVGR